MTLSGCSRSNFWKSSSVAGFALEAFLKQVASRGIHHHRICCGGLHRASWCDRSQFLIPYALAVALAYSLPQFSTGQSSPVLYVPPPALCRKKVSGTCLILLNILNVPMTQAPTRHLEQCDWTFSKALVTSSMKVLRWTPYNRRTPQLVSCHSVIRKVTCYPKFRRIFS